MPSNGEHRYNCARSQARAQPQLSQPVTNGCILTPLLYKSWVFADMPFDHHHTIAVVHSTYRDRWENFSLPDVLRQLALLTEAIFEMTVEQCTCAAPIMT